MGVLKETVHYAAHIVRGFWQEYYINKEKADLHNHKSRALVVIDHKNKILPVHQNEPQNEYFQKSGMSLLGAMVMCGGTEVGDERVSFVDIVMKNTSAQGVTEVRSGIQCL